MTISKEKNKLKWILNLKRVNFIIQKTIKHPPISIKKDANPHYLDTKTENLKYNQLNKNIKQRDILVQNKKNEDDYR